MSISRETRELVRDSLNIKPTSTSYRAAPDRQASQPGKTRQLPAVVRSSPAYNSRGQEHFYQDHESANSITPSRAGEGTKHPGRNRSGVTPKTNARVIQTPQRQRANSNRANTARRTLQSGSRESIGKRLCQSKSGRNAETPRRSRQARITGKLRCRENPLRQHDRILLAEHSAKHNPGALRSSAPSRNNCSVHLPNPTKNRAVSTE